MENDWNSSVSWNFVLTLNWTLNLIIKINTFARFALPHSAPISSAEIAELDEIPITFKINIGVYLPNDKRRELVVNDLTSLFNANDIFSAALKEIVIDPKTVEQIKTPVKLEEVVMQHHKVAPGDLLIVEWKHLGDEILVSSDRTIFVSDKICE